MKQTEIKSLLPYRKAKVYISNSGCSVGFASSSFSSNYTAAGELIQILLESFSAQERVRFCSWLQCQARAAYGFK
ncbi:hypothetical protein K7X08_033089 [Anisodus acutangulus]|uniref:Uncharacterized protein n=1 Tax=Anisodus acutangulus TaxID=402998 RepID=A0A9Q1M0Y1_9SOLA|nr:hypothetical protein K7X08_033089 [Anisodus acutangulus]